MRFITIVPRLLSYSFRPWPQVSHKHFRQLWLLLNLRVSNFSSLVVIINMNDHRNYDESVSMIIHYSCVTNWLTINVELILLLGCYYCYCLGQLGFLLPALIGNAIIAMKWYLRVIISFNIYCTLLDVLYVGGLIGHGISRYVGPSIYDRSVTVVCGGGGLLVIFGIK